MDCMPHPDAMDALRNNLVTRVTGFLNIICPLNNTTPTTSKLEIEVPASQQETKPVPEGDGDEDEDEEEEDDDEHFEWINNIKDDTFIHLLQHYIDPSHDEPNLDDCKISYHTRGSSNKFIFFDWPRGSFIIKMPVSGTKDKWTDGHASRLRSEVFTMKYLHRNTNIPVPNVYAWDNSVENTFGFPFIIMNRWKGMPLNDAWIGRNPGTGELDYESADNPQPKVQKLRNAILGNLAYTMAELRHLEFDKMGMLHFEEDPDLDSAKPPTVGNHSLSNGILGIQEFPSFSMTRLFFTARLEELRGNLAKVWGETNEMLGFQFFYQLLLGTFPSSWNDDLERESFVLTHPRLNMQNIFVSPEGEITSIIDWEGARVVPRCVGYAACPLFLREDWQPGYRPDKGRYTHFPWTLAAYRETYAEFMKDALFPYNKDASYTLKSPLYCAAFEVTDWHPEHPLVFIERLFKEIEPLRTLQKKAFLEKLGGAYEWRAGVEMLYREFEKLFTLDDAANSEAHEFLDVTAVF